MSFVEQLYWCLPKITDLVSYGCFFDGICDTIDVYSAFVCQVVKYVERFYSLPATLLVPKDEVYPSVKVGRDKVGLQGFAHDLYEHVGVVVCPWREDHVVNAATILPIKC